MSDRSKLATEAVPAASARPDEGKVPSDGPRLALAIVCGVILIAMMTLTVVDVIGRYGFNSPLIGATELTELLLVSVVFIGLPAVTLDDGHVSVDLLVSRMPDWIHPWRLIGIGLLSVAVLAVVAWRLWIQGTQIASYGGVTNSLRLPVAPVAWFCSICTVAAIALTFWQLVGQMRALRIRTKI